MSEFADGTATAEESPAASLVGALTAFRLPEVLALLAGTRQTGELQVVGHAVDGRLWLEAGDLCGAAVGSSETLSDAVFELAQVDEGWFYFTVDLPPLHRLAPERVEDVLETVQPRVEEWLQLLEETPLHATVQLSPEPPGSEVQIRAEQWQLLTALGNVPQTVATVVASSRADQVTTLRLLRELADEGLLSVTLPDGSPGATAEAAPAAPLVETEVVDDDEELSTAFGEPELIVDAEVVEAELVDDGSRRDGLTWASVAAGQPIPSDPPLGAPGGIPPVSDDLWTTPSQPEHLGGRRGRS